MPASPDPQTPQALPRPLSGFGLRGGRGAAKRPRHSARPSRARSLRPSQRAASAPQADPVWAAPDPLPAIWLVHWPAEPHPPRPGPATNGGAELAGSRQNRVAGPTPAGYVAPSFFFKPRDGWGLVDCALTWLTVAGSRGARTCGWTCGDPSLGVRAAPPLPDSPRRRRPRRPPPRASRSFSPPPPRRPAAATSGRAQSHVADPPPGPAECWTPRAQVLRFSAPAPGAR